MAIFKYNELWGNLNNSVYCIGIIVCRTMNMHNKGGCSV